MSIRIQLCVLLLAAPALATANDEMISKAKDAVSYDMRDPASAQFREVTYYLRPSKKPDGEPMHVVCGQVNAKNAYGAYVGFRRFFWYDGGSAMVQSETSGPIADAYNDLFDNLCSTN